MSLLQGIHYLKDSLEYFQNCDISDTKVIKGYVKENNVKKQPSVVSQMTEQVRGAKWPN